MKTLDCASCFLIQFFGVLPLPVCFTTEQSTLGLLYLLIIHSSNLHVQIKVSLLSVETSRQYYATELTATVTIHP